MAPALPWVLYYARRGIEYASHELARRAEAQAVVEQTEAELALAGEVDTYIFLLMNDASPEVRASSERMWHEWSAAYEELSDNLESYRQNPQAYASLGLGHWKEALSIVSGFRQTFSYNIQVGYRARIESLRDDVERNAARLGELKEVLERIELRLQNIEGAEEALEIVENLHTAYEMYEVGEHGAASLGDAAKIIGTSKALHAVIGAVAEHARTWAIQSEGYNTLDDLLKEIQNRADAASALAQRMGELQGKVDRAQEIYERPHSGGHRS